MGYLAACFGDGDARVLHVTLPEDDDDTTGFSHMRECQIFIFNMLQ